MDTMPSTEVFSRALRELMEALDVRPAELAERLGVRRPGVNALLQGHSYPRMDRWGQVCGVLGILPEDHLRACRQLEAGVRVRVAVGEYANAPERLRELWVSLVSEVRERLED